MLLVLWIRLGKHEPTNGKVCQVKQQVPVLLMYFFTASGHKYV